MMSRIISRPFVSLFTVVAGFAAPPALAACAVPESQAERVAQAGAMGQATYSLDQMDCAVTIAFAAANAAPDDLQVQMLALGVAADTLDLMGSIKREDLTGTNPGLIERIQQIAAQATALAIAAEAKAPDDPNLKVLHGAILLLQAPWGDVEQGIALTREASGMFDAVIASHPDTLGGLAQMLRGRVYFELPPMLGGDIPKSIALLEDAAKRNPGSAQALRYLAESYDQDMEEEKAQAKLKAMLAITPEAGKYQQLADELRMGIGLAQRLNAGDLVARLGTKRAALFAAHPELLKRESTAVSGHGGANPLTGQ